MNILRLKEFTYKIDGWLTDREGEFLYKIAAMCSGKGIIVEIGSWKGKSTIWIGSGSKAGNKVQVYAIYPHTGSPEHSKTYGDKIWTFEEFKRNIKNAGITDVIVPIVKTSEEAVAGWKKPIDFLFIDGAHEYESVEKDFLLWFPHLSNGGVIAIHDTTSCIKASLFGWLGPKKVADKFIFKSKRFKNVGLLDTITYATKCESNSFTDRIRMKWVRFQKYVPDSMPLLLPTLSRLPKPLKSMGKRLFRMVSAPK